jgi:hypothetical protein
LFLIKFWVQISKICGIKFLKIYDIGPCQMSILYFPWPEQLWSGCPRGGKSFWCFLRSTSEKAEQKTQNHVSGEIRTYDLQLLRGMGSHCAKTPV